MFGKLAVQTPLDVLSRIIEMGPALRANSLAEFTKPSRIEPITMVDQSLVHLPYMQDLFQSLNTLYAAYYLQAFAMKQMTIDGITVRGVLDGLNPNRDVVDNAGLFISNVAGMGKMGLESAGDAEPVLSMGLSILGNNKVSLEQDNRGGGAVSSNANPIPAQITNLSVGKLIDVSFMANGQQVKIPISIRLIVSAMTPQVMAHTLSLGSKATSFRERYHAWREGSIHFWRDGIMCRDLIDAHRAALIKDKSGALIDTLNRRNKNILSGILSMNPSVATASGISVFSSTTRAEIESKIGGRLSNVAVRNKIFDHTYNMILVEVVPDWEQVIIYTRGIAQPTELSVESFKGASKSGGDTDITKVIRALLAGNAPQFN